MGEGVQKESVPAIEEYAGKVAEYSESTLVRIREFLKKQATEGGGMKSPRFRAAAVLAFFGIYMALALILFMITLVLSAVSGVSPQLGIYSAMALSLGIIAYAGFGARSDLQDRKQTYALTQRPNPKSGAQAIEYLGSRDREVRNNALVAIVNACQDGAAAKIVKQSPYEANQIISRLISLLDDEYDPIRSNGANALEWFSRDYPEVVLQYVDEVKTAITYPGSSIRGNLALVLANLGRADPQNADEFAEKLTQIADDEDPEVRYMVATAWGQLPSEMSVEYLRKLTEDQNPDVRERANEALQAHLQGASENASEPEEISPDQNQRKNTTQTELKFVQNPPELDFSDVAGMDDLKERLDEQVLQPFSGSEAFEKFGVGTDTGILFHGPPGTGKTYIAKCLAGELGANFVNVNVGDLESKWLGEGVENITEIFEEARQNQPCVIFIDEIEAVAADRAGDQHDDKKKMVNQLLNELSSIDNDEDLLVLAATNRPEDIDAAFLRDGRFDSKIEIPKPGAEARWKIFQHHMSAPHGPIDQDEFVRSTSGFTASDIEGIARRAAREAAGREQKTGEETLVKVDDILGAIDRIESEQSSVGRFMQSPPDLDFDDVVGMESLKEELTEKVIAPLEDPERFEEFGIGVEHGFLLYGPPGTGKTYMSKCLAGELGINYIEAKAGDLVSKWIGEAAQNVQAMFEEARQNQPCLIFIDEIDALATTRASGNQQQSERQMINQFLEELSSISDRDDDIIVIAASNRPNDVDDAMLRSGRLGEKIEVPPPDASTRVRMFEAHLDAPVDDIDRDWIAEHSEGFVASDMAQVANEAARTALKRVRETDAEAKVTQDDIEQAAKAVKN